MCSYHVICDFSSLLNLDVVQFARILLTMVKHMIFRAMLMTILELGGAIIWTVYHVIEAGVKLLIPDKVDAIDI